MSKENLSFVFMLAMLALLFLFGLYNKKSMYSIANDKTPANKFISSEVAGYKVVKNFGYSCSYFTDDFQDGFTKAMDKLESEIAKGEANALINMRIFSVAGGLTSSAVNICADRVVLEPILEQSK